MTSNETRPRTLASRVEQALDDTRIVVIQGARQVGKSTLAGTLARSRSGLVVTLDDPTSRESAEVDPLGFVRQNGDQLLVIDEIQRSPVLITALKAAVDSDPRPGRYLVTGSANLLRMPAMQDTLAGRAENLDLYGFSQGELDGHQEQFIDRALDGDLFADHQSDLSRGDYLERACAGGYPEALARTTPRRRAVWYDNYLRRVVERDAGDLSGLQRLADLPKLLRLLAARNSGEMVIADLASNSGIPARTLPPYLDLLETLFLTSSLPAWATNHTQRVIRRPKVSLIDTGLAARLLGLSAGGLGSDGPSRAAGGLLEGFVASELLRQLGWSEIAPRLYHFRDRDGPEVDILLESDSGQIFGIEVKASATVTSSDARGLMALRDIVGERFVGGVILHSGPRTVPFGDRIRAVPLDILWRA